MNNLKFDLQRFSKNIEARRNELQLRVAELDKLNRKAESGQGLTEEEEKRFDELLDECENLKEEIEREELFQQKGFDPRNAMGNPADNMRANPGMYGFSPPDLNGPTQSFNLRSYRNLFSKANQPLDNGGFESFREFLGLIESGRRDERLEKLDARHLNTGDGASGGFAVPAEYASWLVDEALGDEIVRPRANVFAMNAPSRSVPAWDSLDRTDGELYGGLQGKWMGQLEEAQDQHPKVREITLSAKKLGIYTTASREAIADAGELESQLMTALRKALSWHLDQAFLIGDGVAKPLGLLNDPALITVSRDTGNEINYTDLVNMYSQLVKGGSPVWIASHSAIPQLMTMENGSANNLIWQPNAREGAPGQLLGIPVFLTDKLPSLGNKGDLLLADLSRYYIGVRQELQLDVSDAPGWYSDYKSWRIIMRVDGQGSWNKPLTLADGNEMSWVVTLAQ